MQPTSETHMAPAPIRFLDKAHVLMSDGWVVRDVCLHICMRMLSLPHHLTHASSWCHSLQLNGLNGSNKQQLQEAAGGRIMLEF